MYGRSEKAENGIISYYFAIFEKEIDLLVDIKYIDPKNDQSLKYFNLSQNIPNLSTWKTFTFASGAFPVDLSKFKIDQDNRIPRLDWLNWKKLFSSKDFNRMPTFSDYTIQHPIYKESLQLYMSSSSLKYALEKEWYILKGKRGEFSLYLANAKLLSGDDAFFGETFSAGDKYIAERGRYFDEYIKNPDPNKKGTGSAETWLRAGINHHLTCTAKQISNLS